MAAWKETMGKVVVGVLQNEECKTIWVQADYYVKSSIAGDYNM